MNIKKQYANHSLNIALDFKKGDSHFVDTQLLNQSGIAVGVLCFHNSNIEQMGISHSVSKELRETFIADSRKYILENS